MSSTDLEEIINFKLSRRRYFILFIVSLILLINGEIFISLPGITPQLEKFFNLSTQDINWFANIFVITLVVLALPSIFFAEIFGIRGCVFIAASFNTIGIIFRVIIIYSPQWNSNLRFGLCLFGNMFPAIAQAFIINLPTLISLQWFGEKERDISTAIMCLSNALGQAFGFVFAYSILEKFSRFENDSYPYQIVFLTEFIFCIMIMIGSFIIMREKPLSPPSRSQENTAMISRELSKLQKFKKIGGEILAIMRNFKVVFYLFAFAGSNASTTLLSAFLTEILKHYFTDLPSYTGFIGFSIIIFGATFTLIFGIFNSVYGPSCQKITGLICNLGSAVFSIIFIVAITSSTKKIELIFFIVVVYGIFAIPYYAIVIEQLADMTFPIEPQISSSLALMCANILGAALILGLGFMDANTKYILSISICAILYFYCSGCIIFVKYTKNRKNCDDSRENVPDIVN